MQTFLKCRFRLKVETVLTFSRGNNAALFFNQSHLILIQTKMSHFHVCYYKLLKGIWRFTIWAMLDMLMVTKGSLVTKYHNVTKRHLLCLVFYTTPVCFLLWLYVGLSYVNVPQKEREIFWNGERCTAYQKSLFLLQVNPNFLFFAVLNKFSKHNFFFFTLWQNVTF